MPSHGFNKNLICRIFVCEADLYFFKHPKGDPLDLQKWFLQCGGVILQEKKFCKTISSSNMSKNALLSASGWNPKLHNYQTSLLLVSLSELKIKYFSVISCKGNWIPMEWVYLYLALFSSQYFHPFTGRKRCLWPMYGIQSACVCWYLDAHVIKKK